MGLPKVEIELMHLIAQAHVLTSALAALIAWFFIGNVFWNMLRSNAETDDELDFIVASEGGAFLFTALRWIAVALWPLWVLIPPVINFVGAGATFCTERLNKRLPF